MTKRKKQRIFIIVLAIITIGLLIYFFKDIMFKLLKYEKENNEEAINALLKDKGLIGMLIIPIVQALQMIVVFISAEFIQIAASISYPWYLTILLCDLGVFIGATAIYYLVKLFKFDTSFIGKNASKIEDMAKRKKKNQGIQSFMYLLFFMPIIPFGAICYYGASTKISYKRYIITCISGVIPSILISMVMGSALKIFISKNISIWLLVLIVILGMIILFGVFGIIISKLYFVSGKGTPDSIYYSVFLKVFGFLAKPKSIVSYDDSKLEGIEGPYLLLSNHGSSYDAYYLANLVSPTRLSFILNRYYFKYRFGRFILPKMGVIPKRLFYPDIETIRKTMTTISNGYSVLMCPEGRLSIDGTNYSINKETGKLIKALKVPVVITKIEGSYLVNPKWRKKAIKGNVFVSVTHVIKKEELESLTIEEINSIIENNISYNDFEYARDNNVKYKGSKAEGLENVLYYCPRCNKEHTLTSLGNKLTCNECRFSLEIQDNYSFNDNEYNINNIHDYYNLIKNYERKNINKGINLISEVKVKKFNFEKHTTTKGSGVCKLDNHKFTFIGNVGEEITFNIDIDKLKALAFSVNEEFECYYNQELYYFYPLDNPKECVKWALLVDLMNEEDKNNE